MGHADLPAGHFKQARQPGDTQARGDEWLQGLRLQWGC